MTDTILCVVCDVFKDKDKFHQINKFDNNPHYRKMGLCKYCHEKAQNIIKEWSNEVVVSREHLEWLMNSLHTEFYMNDQGDCRTAQKDWDKLHKIRGELE